MSSPAFIPALACTAPFGFAADPAEALAAFARLGCTACQFYRKIDNPLDAAARRNSVDLKAVISAASSAGMRFDSIHGVFSEYINPSSHDQDHRRECLEIYEDEAKLALSLGGPMVVVHPGALNPDKRWLSSVDAAESQRRSNVDLADFLPRLRDVGERLGVTFLIENLPFSCTTGFDPSFLADHIRRVNSPRVRMCLDTGHAHCTVGSAACPWLQTVAHAIYSCADVIAYFHIHDNNADADTHLIPGNGTIDWETVREALASHRATRMLELFQAATTINALSGNDFRSRLHSWLHTAA